MNHTIFQTELFLLLTDASFAAKDKTVLKNTLFAFYDCLSDQVDSTDYCTAHRLLTKVEGRLNTLREEISLSTYEAEKKHSKLSDLRN